MGRLYPVLDDLWLKHSMLGNIGVQFLDPTAFKALMMLVFYTGAGRVWTMTEPMDGSFSDDDVLIARLAMTTVRRWKRVRPAVEPFFEVKAGRWHLREDWIAIGSEGRGSIPEAAKMAASSRHKAQCSYCGATDTSLEYDHIFPVALGGSDDPSNLTLACPRCNRSKGKRTLWEWMNGRR